jgi:hypothetical protein
MVQDEEGLANRQTKFLQFLAQENHSPFFDKMTYRHVKSGERFVVQDAVEDTAYIIQRGSCLVVVEKDGELHPVNHYGEGDIIGGLGILTGEPRRAHVEAETDMDLWVMTKGQFDKMTEKDPALLDFITELVADRLDSRRPTAYRTIGKYVATDIIGRGAFSIVYEGIHKSLNMPVVIKMMRHDMAFLYLLQQIAELPPNKDGFNVFIFGLLHQSFIDYAHGLASAQRNEWAKIQGRFEDIPFIESSDKMLRLIGQAIDQSKDKTFRSAVDQWAVKWHPKT